MSSLMDKLENNLKSADIVSIIRACRKFGVAHLKLSTLEIAFHQEPMQANLWPDHVEMPKSDDNSLKQIVDSHPETKNKLSEDDLEALRIQDPFSFEQMQLLGELE